MKVEITDNSVKIKEAMGRAKLAALEAIGLQAEGYAKIKCPVRTGNLRDSISHDKDKDNAYVGTNVDYAMYVEFGTDKVAARPYLKPAATEHSAEYRAIAENQLRNA